MTFTNSALRLAQSTSLSSGRLVLRVTGVNVDPDARLTPAELPVLARMLGVSAACMRMWRHREQLVPDDDGLYRLGDVLTLNGQKRRHPNSRRRLVAA